ncbi:MAG TPA: extracellular solute-binding protein [Streptosporangiaceae bacterium]|nr:extracellular solute-binding protein [Streptosporangiaceae bacterium]
MRVNSAHKHRRRGARASLALAVAAAAAVAGCATGSAATASGPLQVWVRGATDSAKAYQAIFSAFTKKTGIKVSMFSTLTDFETKLNAAAAAHNLPDVVIDDAAQLGAFQSQGILQPVDRSAITGSDEVTSLAWDSARGSDGKFYAVPFSAQADLLFERTDWAHKLGLKPPTDWAGIVSTAQAFTHGNPTGNRSVHTYGLTVPGSTTRGYVSWFWTTFLYQAGGQYFTQTRPGKYVPAIDSPQAVQAAQWFENLFCTDKVVQPGALNDLTTDANKAFETGLTGLYLTGPYAFATFDASPVQGKFTAMAPPPGVANADTLAEGTNIYLMAGSKRTDEATRLAEFLITPQAQQLGMTAVPAATVVRLSVDKTVNTAAIHHNDPRWVLEEHEYTQHGRYEPDYMPDWEVYRQDTSDALNKMLAQCSSPATTLKALATQYTTLLKQQGVFGG